jgi:hypothetical protein
MAAQPLLAQEQMSRTKCQEMFQRFVDLVDPDNPDRAVQVQYIRVTPDSWCQIKSRDPGYDEGLFETFEWRMEESALWRDEGIPPLALEVRIAGLDPDKLDGQPDLRRPDVDIEVTLRQEPDAGLVLLERAFASNGVGDELSVSGVFERVFLSSEAMMQVSMGSAAFKAGLVSMTLEGTHENPFGFYVDVDVQGGEQAQSEGAFDIISRLPDGVIDDASRAELTAFAGDLPRPVGTLEVSVASERGLGLMQVGMSAFLAMDSMWEGNPDEDRKQLEVLFDGVSVQADWSPAAQVAD